MSRGRRSAWLVAATWAATAVARGQTPPPGVHPAPAPPPRAPAPPARSAGTFALASRATVALTAPAAATESVVTDETAELASTSATALRLALTRATGERCVLLATRAGTIGMDFAPGQRCAMTARAGAVRLELTLRSGTGALAGEVLSLALEWSVESPSSLRGTVFHRGVGPRVPPPRALAPTSPAPWTAPTAGALAPTPPGALRGAVPYPSIYPTLPWQSVASTHGWSVDPWRSPGASPPGVLAPPATPSWYAAPYATPVYPRR